MWSGCGRLLSSALQVSPLGRVDASHSLLRVGCHGRDDVVQELCRGATHHCLTSYCGPATPAVAVERFAASHVRRAAARQSAVAVPRWAEVSQEQTVLDVFNLAGSELQPSSGVASSSRSAPAAIGAKEDNELRCNAAVVLHETEAAGALEDLEHITTRLLPALAEHRIPAVLAGVVEASALAQSGRFAAMSLYGRWRRRYEEVARQRLGHVYAVHFFCPQDPQGCFDLLYRAQMSVLYPLGRCFTSLGHDAWGPTPALLAAAQEIFAACDLDDDRLWDAGDWEAFWKAVYGRAPTEEEASELSSAGLLGASQERLVQWFLELVATGRGDSLWACLRAFGYDGALRRVDISADS